MATVKAKQSSLFLRLSAAGFQLKQEAEFRAHFEEVVKTSEIEGEELDHDEVRSSIALKLGLEVAGLKFKSVDKDVEGIVEVVLDAVNNYEQHLNDARIQHWHSRLFPAGRAGAYKITAGAWRTDKYGPMRVISGPMGNKAKIHFEAPPAEVLVGEVEKFLIWFNQSSRDLPEIEPLLKAAISHLWFVTLHPFDDGNGRIARAIADMSLARADGQDKRYYSMSYQIKKERKQYYKVLESTQKGGLDITDWLVWFLRCLSGAIDSSEELLKGVFLRASFWQSHAGIALSDRQLKVIKKVLDGFEGRLTSSKWAKIAKCSQDTASRDIADLIQKGVLKRGKAGGRSTSFELTN